MTRKTRLALYRVRNHARRLVQAIDALGPEAVNAMWSRSSWNANAAGSAVDYAKTWANTTDVRLTRILEDGDDK